MSRLQGRVFRGSSGNYSIHVTGHEPAVYSVRLRGTLKKELVYSESGSRPRRVVSSHKRRATDPVTVGDVVLFDPELKVIESVLPRATELARKSPSSSEQHVLVANLDTLFVVVSAANPPPNLWTVDRFIVVAENQEIGVEIVVNKRDLVPQEAGPAADALRAQFAPYAAIGYRVRYTSARTGDGIPALRDALRGHVAAFAGNSGVGKSSLLNAIQPGLKLKTGMISEINSKGKHTTTQAELVPILDRASDTWLADTPGLRQLDFWELDTGEVEYGFREVRELAPDCQFGNCTHRAEPGCAVSAAVEQGTVDARRWRSYVELYNEVSGVVPAVE